MTHRAPALPGMAEHTSPDRHRTGAECAACGATSCRCEARGIEAVSLFADPEAAGVIEHQALDLDPAHLHPHHRGGLTMQHHEHSPSNEDDGPDGAAEAVALVHASGGIGRNLLDECPRPAAILLTDWHIDETTTSTEAATYAVDLIGRLYAAGYRIVARTTTRPNR